MGQSPPGKDTGGVPFTPLSKHGPLPSASRESTPWPSLSPSTDMEGDCIRDTTPERARLQSERALSQVSERASGGGGHPGLEPLGTICIHR
jgi:hypothetical protein